MIKVGVTGGIGSGKTTLCKEWEKLGAYVVYADALAKDLMVEDKQLVQGIKRTFGSESYLANGSLNRAYLAEEAFNKGRVKELNELVHPVLWNAIDQIAEEKEKQGIEVFVKEAAILLQHGRPKDLDFVVLVTAERNSRIDRVIERDKTRKEEVINRISKQQDFETLKEKIDFTIINNGSLEDLRSKARNLLIEIKKF
jgi:dephospho-CoA kinase